MLRTFMHLDGHGRLELIKFHSPLNQGDYRHAPANTPVSATSHSPSRTSTSSLPACEPAALKLVGELERYEDSYRLCYVRGPEGIIIELAEQIGQHPLGFSHASSQPPHVTLQHIDRLPAGDSVGALFFPWLFRRSSRLRRVSEQIDPGRRFHGYLPQASYPGKAAARRGSIGQLGSGGPCTRHNRALPRRTAVKG